jgi:hypothetical protein
MVRAYDEATQSWSNMADVEMSASGKAHFDPNGSQDPALGYVPGCSAIDLAGFGREHFLPNPCESRDGGEPGRPEIGTALGELLAKAGNINNGRDRFLQSRFVYGYPPDCVTAVTDFHRPNPVLRDHCDAQDREGLSRRAFTRIAVAGKEMPGGAQA